MIVGLMGIAYGVSATGDVAGKSSLEALMIAPAVFAFGLVAFGFLGMGPVTIAVDSYGPVADNAQSIFELSTLASQPNAQREIKEEFGFDPDFEKGKHFLEENDGAGNTFKATAKPVLIGTAVVGATTLIFSIIMVLTDGLTNVVAKGNLSLLHPPFLLGSDYRRRRDLLVHRRLDAGGRDRRVSGRRIHQSQYPSSIAAPKVRRLKIASASSRFARNTPNAACSISFWPCSSSRSPSPASANTSSSVT